MKKIITSLAIALTAGFAQAQTTAMDFNRADCNGFMHHLFTNDLDSGNVVILEFFMGGGCTSCITAGHALESMKASLLAAHPSKIRSYASGFLNTMNCATVSSWVSTNGFTSTPNDSGEAQVAYYGGFGMPTIVILGGTAHSILYTDIGFTNSDTVAMKSIINSFFAGTLDTKAITSTENMFSVFPNPASDKLHLRLSLKEQANVSVQVMNVAGEVFSVSTFENVPAGTFSKAINTSGLANGLYVARASVNGSTYYSRFSVAR